MAPQATLGTMEEEWGLKLNAECNLNFLGVIMDPPEIWTHFHIELWSLIVLYYTSSTAQGGGGSFKNRKPIGEVGCCESGMAERSH